MKVFTGLLTLSGPGVREYYVGFQPDLVEFIVCQAYGVDDQQSHMSIGASDGVRQNCQTMFHDGYGTGPCRMTRERCVWHHERQADGVIREVVVATKVTPTTYGFKINILAGTPRYQTAIRAIKAT